MVMRQKRECYLHVDMVIHGSSSAGVWTSYEVIMDHIDEIA